MIPLAFDHKNQPIQLLIKIIWQNYPLLCATIIARLSFLFKTCLSAQFVLLRNLAKVSYQNQPYVRNTFFLLIVSFFSDKIKLIGLKQMKELFHLCVGFRKFSFLAPTRSSRKANVHSFVRSVQTCLELSNSQQSLRVSSGSLQCLFRVSSSSLQALFKLSLSSL